MTAQYFGKFNKARQDRWVFGDRRGGSYMHRFSWTSIVRHQTVWQGRHPTTHARRVLGPTKTQTSPADQQHQPVAAQGPGRMLPDLQDPALRRPATNPNDWETWLTAARTTITIVKPATGTPDETEHRLIHAACNGPALLPAYEPSRLA